MKVVIVKVVIVKVITAKVVVTVVNLNVEDGWKIPTVAEIGKMESSTITFFFNMKDLIK